MKFDRQIAYELGKTGLVVVSDLAKGIDIAAHNSSNSLQNDKRAIAIQPELFYEM